MGNSLHGDSLLSNGNRTSNHVRLGTHATIDLTEKKDRQYGKSIVDIEEWTVQYNVDGARCILQLRRLSDPYGNVKKASFILYNGTVLDFTVKTNPVEIQTSIAPGDDEHEHTKSWGDITRTETYFFGSGNKGGLLVCHSKYKSMMDTTLDMVTVAHYYAAIVGNVFDRTRMDIGLSVIAKIRVSNNGNLDITVEGPAQHPATALFYMIDEVKRTRIWKPTTCPHCDNIIKRQRGGMFWQAESEDSDGPPPSRLHGPKQNAGSFLANDGAVRGNNNGNFIVNRLLLGRK